MLAERRRTRTLLTSLERFPRVVPHLLVLTAVAVSACGGDANSPSGPDGERVPVRLTFIVQPSETEIGFAIGPAVQVAIQDANGNPVTTANHSVTIALNTNPTNATLAGTTTVDAIGGIATFSDLAIDKISSGYTLVATAQGLDPTTSAIFEVVFLFASVAAGGTHTCGITTGGATYCWGNNTAGQLGFVGPASGNSRPVRLPGSDFVSLIAGLDHTCGMDHAGAAHCWGDNREGELGDGTTNTRALPGSVSGGLSFVALGAGDAHTCGVTPSGQAYCWGQAGRGQLGDGTMSGNMTTPVAVSGARIYLNLSAGYDYSCALANTNRAYCWGEGSEGQLGDGSNTRRFNPRPVEGSMEFQSLSAGSVNTCAVTPDGVVYCWGHRIEGASTNVPEMVPGAPSLLSVDAGALFSCGLTSAGEAYCWGTNVYGQLGNTTGDCNLGPCSPEPIAVAGGLTFESLSSGFSHVCGITTVGGLYCWGLDGSGQLGVGGATEICVANQPCSRMPVRVTHPNS